MEREEDLTALMDLLSEGWRLHGFAANLIDHMQDEKWRKKWGNQSARYRKRLKDSLEVLGLELLDFTGQEFEEGLPVYPINLEDFAPGDALVVDRMIEPTIKKKDAADLLRKGSVVLRRKIA